VEPQEPLVEAKVTTAVMVNKVQALGLVVAAVAQVELAALEHQQPLAQVVLELYQR
jgi:hypothetical protein